MTTKKNRIDGAARTSLDEVLATDAWTRRPSRTSDPVAENRALAGLANTLATAPGSVLQQLAERALDLCKADSVAVSVLESDQSQGTARWHTVKGQLSACITTGSIRELGPCDIVRERNASLLFTDPARHFRSLESIKPPIVEALLVPFHVGGKPVGTIWLIAHSASRQFDREDERLITNLANIASTAYQLLAAFHSVSQLEQRVFERTANLRGSEERLRLFVEHAPAALAMFDREMRYLVASRRWRGDYGLASTDLIGRSHYEIFPEIPERWRASHRRGLSGEVVRMDEDCFVRADGRKQWLRWEVRPWYLPEGEIGGIVIFTEEITQRKLAEDALRENEERLRLAVRASNVGLWDWDLRTNAVVFSPEWKAQLGYSVGEIRDTFDEWESRVHPDDLGPALHRIHLTITGPGSSHEVEFRMRHKTGSWRWIAARAEVVRDSDGVAVRMLGCHLDITDRKQADEALRASHDRLQKVLDNEAVGVMFWDLTTGRMTDANETFLKLMGYSRAEVETGELTWQRLTPPEYVEASLAEIRKFQATGRVGPYEKEYFRKDGARQWLVFAGSSLGASTCVEFCVDISDRKKTEKALREIQDRLELAQQVGQVGIFHWDIVANRSAWTAVHEAIYGLAPGSFKGDHDDWIRRVHPDDRPRIEAEVVRCFSERRTVNEVDYRIVRDDGEQRWVSNRGMITYSPEGIPVQMVGTTVDITERKLAEEALRQSAERERAILASLSAHIAVVDRMGRIVAVNPAWEQFGNENQAIAARCNAGVNYLEVCQAATGSDAKEASAVVAGLKEILSGSASEFKIEYPCHTQGQERWFLLHATRLLGVSGGAVLSHTNITDRVKAELRARANEHRLRAILDSAVDAIITINHQGIIQAVNKGTEMLFGYSAPEMIGQNVSLLMPVPYHDEHDEYLANYLRTGTRKILGIGREIVARRKDASVFPIELAVNEIPELKLFTGIVHDISRRKDLEREVVEIASLEQRRIGQDLHDTVSQEMTALGIQAMSLAAALATAPAETVELVEKMTQGLRRSHQQLRAVMRGLLPVSVDTEGLMAALAELAERTEKHHKVICTFICPEPVSLADNLIATHLYLIAQEAIHNALKHSTAKSILIRLEANNRLVLCVQDDGTGLPESKRKSTGASGLGLRIMQNRAAILGATLTIEKVEPTGTRILCTLPGKSHGEKKYRETRSDSDRR